MRAHLFKSPKDNGADEFVIFARDSVRASQVFHLFWTNLDKIPVQWAGEDWEVFELFGTRSQLKEAEGRDQEGLGIFDEMSGWTIEPPPEPNAAWEYF